MILYHSSLLKWPRSGTHIEAHNIPPYWNGPGQELILRHAIYLPTEMAQVRNSYWGTQYTSLLKWPRSGTHIEAHNIPPYWNGPGQELILRHTIYLPTEMAQVRNSYWGTQYTSLLKCLRSGTHIEAYNIPPYWNGPGQELILRHTIYLPTEMAQVRNSYWGIQYTSLLKWPRSGTHIEAHNIPPYWNGPGQELILRHTIYLPTEMAQVINIQRPRQNGCHIPDNIFQCIFLNDNV